ncbi:helix-turn-helix domain-containing protein [Segnochrobactrum spirostomi]|uniref:AraC family transcriptional regulator n=1 Tax=Segnochrobactrum spirostomi TaxID=2608987 RepID=A0A6A7Y5J8_9HYPH|nr:helix-turn-helix domain-containing protein [Segnochrobactrum spirostomi]MQT14483.1 AraC family transcriptional regulator [Segnochrobactrum spirostomi]
MRHAALMAETAERTDTPPAYQAALRDGLISLLLDGLIRRDEAPAAGPASVRRAEAYARAHLGQALSMADLAEAAGVGLRSLQETFKRTRGLTLTEWLQAARLEEFRKALLSADGSRSVTELALAAGLGHLGRAAAAYRVRFGETPSETLRRVRTRG